MKSMSNASKTALGGMAVALSVVLMLPTAFEIFVYALYHLQCINFKPVAGL